MVLSDNMQHSIFEDAWFEPNGNVQTMSEPPPMMRREPELTIGKKNIFFLYRGTAATGGFSMLGSYFIYIFFVTPRPLFRVLAIRFAVMGDQ